MNLKLNGKAKWAFLRQPEKYDGKELGYSIQVEMPPEKLAELKLALIGYFENELESGSLMGKQVNKTKDITLPIKEDMEGTELVKAKTKHTYVNKATGETFKKVLPVFDKHGKPLNMDINVGNGSVVQVAVEPKAYVVNKNNFGVTLYLTGVLVKELIEYKGGMSAEALGFDIEEDVANDEEVEF